MYLLILSKYLTYAFICENFVDNDDGRAVPSYIYIYPIKYLYEPLLLYDSFFNNIILLISTLSTLTDFSYI